MVTFTYKSYMYIVYIVSAVFVAMQADHDSVFTFNEMKRKHCWFNWGTVQPCVNIQIL